MTGNAIAREIVDAAFDSHHAWTGPARVRLTMRSWRMSYEGVRINTGFRADLIVEDKVIVEIKSVEQVAPVRKKQLLTYLQLADNP